MKGLGLALVLAGPAVARPVVAGPVRVCASFAVGEGGPISITVTAEDRVTQIDAPLTPQGQGFRRSWTEAGAFARALPLFAGPSAWRDMPREDWGDANAGYCAIGMRMVLTVAGPEAVTTYAESACPGTEMLAVLAGLQEAFPPPSDVTMDVLDQPWDAVHDPCGRP